MQHVMPERAPWLKTDKTYRWRKNWFQIRFEFHSQRITLLPVIGIDWEFGMFTVAFVWLMFGLLFDFEYTKDYDESDQAEYPFTR